MDWTVLIFSWLAITTYGFTLWAAIWYAGKAADWKEMYEEVLANQKALFRSRDRQAVEEAERYTQQATRGVGS